MLRIAVFAFSIVASAGLSIAQDLIFADDFEWGSICAWSNLWYVDSDGDDWGAEGTNGIGVSCPPPGGYAPHQGDCDDINPLINPGATELCDLVDNDCNPTTDDGIGESWHGDPCDGGDMDLCEEGIFLCTDAVQVCSDDSDDTMDLCNSIDDDCNPVTPDGIDEPWNGDPCDGADGDLCDEGISSCVAGAQVCDDETDDTPDICNGLDDDCDPTSPDGSEDPLNGSACDTGLPGMCSAGTTNCLAGSLTCEQDTFPTSEVCDGLDNDCDGIEDEGNPGGGAACITGLPGVCSSGTTNCTSGSLTCEQDTFPTSEVCDGLDNDCDGIEDEGNPGGGAACITGLPGVCAEGTTACESGSLQCIQDVEASEEICDDLVDNDCNGEVDCDDASCVFDPWCVSDLIISEVCDHPTNSSARYVEIFNPTAAEIYFINYQLNRYSNGSTSPSSFSFSGSIASGQAKVVAWNATDFNLEFGLTADWVSYVAAGNGDDVFELLHDGETIDIYGVIGVDGTGEDWDYTDSVATRFPSVCKGTLTWTASEWIITMEPYDCSPQAHSCDCP